MGLTTEGGPEAHAEIHQLLSNGIFQFDQAIEATAVHGNAAVTEAGVEAGYTIFDATLTTLSHFHVEGNLPTFGDDWGTDANGVVFPLPILVAMAHFLDSTQMVSLKEYGLSSGNRGLDSSVIHWSNTILWGLPAKRRFFYDLVEFYAGVRVENPLLSDNRLRAIQLLVVGCHLLREQLEKIGQPKEFKIYLPD